MNTGEEFELQIDQSSPRASMQMTDGRETLLHSMQSHNNSFINSRTSVSSKLADIHETAAFG